MATRQKLKEEFLTCIICHEVFRDPVTLHCGHTFCAQCVTAYTKTQKQAIANECISCPTCHELTKVPEPQRAVEKWAGQIKTGFFVKGLVETFTKELSVDMCSVCKEDGENKPATVRCLDCKNSICTDCEKYHRRFNAGHKTEKVSLTTKPKIGGQPCPEHGDSYIDMLCEDCDTALCQICCIVYHRKCRSIIPLKQALPKLNMILKNEKQALMKQVEDLENMISVKKFQAERLETTSANAEKNIESWMENIVSQVRKKETKLKEKLNEDKEKAVKHLRDDIKHSEMEVNKANSRQVSIDQAQQSAIDMDHYDMYKKCKSENATKDLSNVEEQENRVIHIEYDETEVKNLLETFEKTSLGQIKLSKNVEKSIPNEIQSNAEKPIPDTIYTGLFDICGLVVMSVGNLTVVVCAGDKYVKSFFIEDDTQKQSCVFLGSPPTGLSQIDHTRGVVSIFSLNQILFFQVQPKVQQESVVKTQRGYKAITYLYKSTFAAYFESGKTPIDYGYDIINDSGLIIRTFPSIPMSGSIHMSSIGSSIFVLNSNKLICFTDQGKLIPFNTQMKVKAIFISDKVQENLLAFLGVPEINYDGYTASKYMISEMTMSGEIVRDIKKYLAEPKHSPYLAADEDGLVYYAHHQLFQHQYQRPQYAIDVLSTRIQCP